MDGEIRMKGGGEKGRGEEGKGGREEFLNSDLVKCGFYL